MSAKIKVSEVAGLLAIDIMRNDFHRPFVDGKCNREKIEEEITIAVLAGDLSYPITQEIVDLACDSIDYLIVEN